MALIEPAGRSLGDRLGRRPDLIGIRERVRNAPYLRKWVILGALIGLISGFGAVLFFWALDLATRFFLGTLAGFARRHLPVKVARRSSTSAGHGPCP